MAGEVQANDFQQKVYNSIKSTVDKADQEVSDKQKEYEANQKLLEYFTNLRNKAYNKMQSIKKTSNPDESELQQAKVQYANADESYSNSYIDTDVSLWGLRSRMSYASKMNNSLTIANGMLG